MERSPAVVWTCLLGAGLALVQPSALPVTALKTSARPPRLIGCVFIIQSNITCHWEPGDTPATHYTLQVQRTPGFKPPAASSLKTFTCTTSGTSCTAGIGGSTVRIIYCIRVTAHGGSLNISSEPRCQPGRKEVILPPVILKRVNPVHGSPECLGVVWQRVLSDFPVSDSEIEDRQLNSQIEFTAQEQQAQTDVQVRNVTVADKRILVCLFKPDTSYIIRLRNRYQGPASPWSAWSNSLQGRTAEDAPSAAPVFWMQVKHTDRTGWRLVSLLWKPLPQFLANGRVLFYNVTCETESAQVLSDGSCRDLHHPSASCSLLLPSGRCSCALTASTSAGTSPKARISLLSASDTEPPPPKQITASPLDDSSFEVRWTSPWNRSVSGFVVEWFAVREKTSSILHWEKLNSSSTTLVITEGVKPMERYAVSVKTLYGERGAGKNRTLYIYTRQGIPSAGPNVKVQNISVSTVEVSWSSVAVELLHGYLCNYTLWYRTANQPARSVSVPGHVHRYTLENLLPGNYDIYMQARTVAGTGPAGNLANVHIGYEELSIVISIIIPLMLTSLALILIACVAQMKMVRQKLCLGIPDPSNSSLSQWIPETLERKEPFVLQKKLDIKYSDVILLDKLQDLEKDDSYQSVHNFHTYSLQQLSPLIDRMSVKASTRSMTKAKTTSATDLSTSSCVYSSILHSQLLKNLPTAIPPSSNHSSNDWQPRTLFKSGAEMSKLRPE
ncbi:interleukin-6 receptor subunit beta-like [Leuresthes tenuis]|uniref:interleukin-6 receptor subunit beta-like n=1 Tax=Leuresthes tenuis TaxID=355514 RepID=UPI003B50155D